MTRLEKRLAALGTMSPAELRGAWLQTFKSPAPAVGRTLLALGIAHRLQEKVFGRLAAGYTRELARLGQRFDKTGEIGADAAAMLKAGTRLVREWQGECHHILICDDRYVYRDRQYKSLSQIAKQITGAHWSGPRFFGLKSSRKRHSRGQR